MFYWKKVIGMLKKMLDMRTVSAKFCCWHSFQSRLFIHHVTSHTSPALNNIWWNETIANPAVTLVKESPVTSIDSSADDSFVMVEDSRNNVYKAKHVVITASIAVLKSGAISFTPTLPKDTVSTSFFPFLATLVYSIQSDWLLLFMFVPLSLLNKVRCYW